MNRRPPRRLSTGVIVPSGLGSRPRSEMAANSLLVPWRGLVVATRLYDDEDNQRGRVVECDVILVARNTTLYDVPVMQTHHGFQNTGPLWQPKAASRDTANAETPVNLTRQRTHRKQLVGEATYYGATDGEMVLVEFLEGDETMPVITGSYPHQRSRRRIVKGEGWREGDLTSQGEMREGEFYFHHAGTEVRINELGDFLIDTVKAHADPENEDPSTGEGQIRFRVKDSKRFTVAMHDGTNMVDVLEVFREGGQVKVDLGAGATQRLILGDLFKDFLNNFLGVEYQTHTHPHPVGGTTGPPTLPATQMQDTLLSDLSRTKKS